MPQPNDYDFLYYTLLKSKHEIKEFIADGIRYIFILFLLHSAERFDIDHNCLSNVKTILSHFTEKLEEWTELHPGSTVSEAIVLYPFFTCIQSCCRL